MLRDRYGGGVKLVIQTAGDLLGPKIIHELLERDVWMISVSSIDDFHVRNKDRTEVQEALTGMFEAAGIRRSGLSATVRKWSDEQGPVYSFFGATPEAWIGKLWPAGRAWENRLSTAEFKDNFCNNWSGGLNRHDLDQWRKLPGHEARKAALRAVHPSFAQLRPGAGGPAVMGLRNSDPDARVTVSPVGALTDEGEMAFRFLAAGPEY